jgi:hypothetical protein
MDSVFLDSIYHKLVAAGDEVGMATIRRVLNFEEAYAQANRQKAFPLLGRYDQYICYERQKQGYGDRPITVPDKGHVGEQKICWRLPNSLASFVKRTGSKMVRSIAACLRPPASRPFGAAGWRLDKSFYLH